MNTLIRRSNYGNHTTENLSNDTVSASAVREFPQITAEASAVDLGPAPQEFMDEETVTARTAVSVDSIAVDDNSHFAGMAVRGAYAGPASVGKDDNGFETYIVPVQSTDYKGLEAIDPRLVDREWRLDNLYKVINENGEIVQFKLRPAQKKLLREMHYRNILLKARQLGFTTFICLFILDYVLFNRNKLTGIVGPTQNDTSNIFRKIKVAWDNFPEQIKGFLGLKTTGDSKVEYEFNNGSVIRIATSLRSGTYQCVLITEFGKISARFPDKAEEVITGTLPACPPKSIVFIESTAEGEDGEYYDLVQDAIENQKMQRPLTSKEFKFFFFPWYENPTNVIEGTIGMPLDVEQYLDKVERVTHTMLNQSQRNWYYLESKIQKTKMKQEHPSTPAEAFLSSGNKLFDGPMVEKHREEFACEPLEIVGDFRVFKRYNKTHTYGLGADVSQGVKRDSSTIAIIDFNTGEVVLTYRSNDIDPVLFAHEIKKAALMYGGCIAAPEANSVGQTTCVTLNSIYTNVYTQEREGSTEVVRTNKLGWLTTGLSKPRMMYELSDAMTDELVIIYDEAVLNEMKRMNKEDTLQVTTPTSADSSEKKQTRHFDLLIAVAIAYQMRAYAKRGLADPEDIAKVEHRREENIHRQKGKYR